MASLATDPACCSSSYGLRSPSIRGAHLALLRVPVVSLGIRKLSCAPHCYPDSNCRSSGVGFGGGGGGGGATNAAHRRRARFEFGFLKSASETGVRWRRQQQLFCSCGRQSSGACGSGHGFRRSLRCDDRGGLEAVSGDRLGEPESSSSGERRDEELLGSPETTKVPISRRISLFQNAFWRFLRPHTIRGTLLGSTALVTRALIENPQLIDWNLLPRALCGLLALVCGNGYIVGINQIYDVGIDKINKPFLPIAAGDLTIPVAWGLVLGLATLGIGIVGVNFGRLITVLYSLGLFLGTIYSVPPLHLKRFAVPAFLIIATVRGFLLNFGVYYATRAALGLTFEWNPSILFITSFVTVFAVVIAITKDLPDIEGDRKFRIATFATRLGVRNISFLGAGLLLSNYVGAIVSAIYWPQYFNRKVVIFCHAFLAGALVYQTWLLDSAKYTKGSIADFYRFVWNLFYSEYTLLPFI